MNMYWFSGEIEAGKNLLFAMEFCIGIQYKKMTVSKVKAKSIEIVISIWHMGDTNLWDFNDENLWDFDDENRIDFQWKISVVKNILIFN